MKAIKVIFDCINSKPDRAGNCYWAFRYTETATGKQVVGKISGGESNLNAARFILVPGDEYYATSHALGCREFSHLTADWPYAGCSPEEISEFIKRRLDPFTATINPAKL